MESKRVFFVAQTLLASRIGNPEGAEKPNKKYYDPRMSLRSGEEFMAERLFKCMEDLKCIDRL